MDGTPGLQTGTFAGRYTIERELGRGATATVYLARDTQRGHGVAIKVLRPELAESLGADRFLKEIKVNERLHHPHIASVLDSGQYEGRLYFVLPHMEGGSLRQLLQREKQLPIETAVSITRTIALALDYAHKQGLIHRDVKPENILFTSGQACLADFGIARAIERAIDETTTSTGLVRGTPAYMSPEQASGSSKYDGRSDQYSLACVLYEMLAGVPAFIGPTPEAIIAMRFQHPPRAVRVFRPTVPPALADVIDRALSLAPADRYGTMEEFANAMDAALRAPIVESRTSGGVAGLRANRTAILGAVVFAIVVLATLGVALSRSSWWRGVPADTTRIAVMPFTVTPGVTIDAGPQEQLHAALRRWNGIMPVPLDQLGDAVRKAGGDSALTSQSRRAVALTLGAARYVVGRVITTPTGIAISADLRDVDRGTLYTSQVDLPTDKRRVSSAYAALADSLLLRGTSDRRDGSAPSSRNIVAVQTFIAAAAARDEWDLARADSLFGLAASLDPLYARAHLWRAQVRDWREIDSNQWVSGAERATADSLSLSGVEREMAHGLLALAEGDFLEACRLYRDMIERDSRSFVGWYGLGECHRRDRTVIRDPRVPSGWRFRSSLNQAATAYARAFELIPATYRGFQAEGYQRLRELLFTSGRQMRLGTSKTTPPRQFLGVPVLVGDTIALVTYDRADVLAGRVRAAAAPEAIAKLRAVFDSITIRWASAFPRSAGAKEALALSLELRGDPSALDSMLSAERLATDASQRLRLRAARIVLQTKFGISDVVALTHARAAADSLLRDAEALPREQRVVLAPLAALTGRCALTSRLLASVAPPLVSGDISISQDVNADAQGVLGYVASGCRTPRTLPTLDALAHRIVLSASAEKSRLTAEYMLLGGIVRAQTPMDSAWIVRLAPVGGGLLGAKRDLLLGERKRAHDQLNQLVRLRRGALPGEINADVVLPEAQTFLMLGDTLAAVASLQSALSTMRYASPLAADQTSYNVSRLGFLTQALALDAELLQHRDVGASRRYAAAAATLWSNADAGLQPIVARMRQLAR